MRPPSPNKPPALAFDVAAAVISAAAVMMTE
jgi:hypothetical protein